MNLAKVSNLRFEIFKLGMKDYGNTDLEISNFLKYK